MILNTSGMPVGTDDHSCAIINGLVRMITLTAIMIARYAINLINMPLVAFNPPGSNQASVIMSFAWCRVDCNVTRAKGK
jgi:hypothetical protein